MKNHVENVGVMADVMFEEIKAHPEKWRETFDIPKDAPLDDQLKNQIKEFIGNHDASKLNTTKPFLEKIKRETGLINDLYSVYGKTFNTMTDKEKKVVDALNIVDGAEREAFIKAHNLPSWKIKLLDEVEKMADGVERGMNPVTAEEMSKSVWKQSEAAQNKLKSATAAASDIKEINKFKNKLELTLLLEKKYPKEAVSLIQYRDRMNKINLALRESGVFTEYLDEFSSYRLIDEFEKLNGKKINPNDPQLIAKFKTFFFKNNRGLSLLKSSIAPQVKNEANIMIELGRYEVSPVKEGKWKNLFEAFGGACAN